MIHSSYESSNLGESNGTKFISIVLILIVLSSFKDLDILLIILEFSNWISIIFVRLDSAYQENSIDMCFMSVALILIKLSAVI